MALLEGKFNPQALNSLVLARFTQDAIAQKHRLLGHTWATFDELNEDGQDY